VGGGAAAPGLAGEAAQRVVAGRPALAVAVDRDQAIERVVVVLDRARGCLAAAQAEALVMGETLAVGGAQAIAGADLHDAEAGLREQVAGGIPAVALARAIAVPRLDQAVQTVVAVRHHASLRVERLQQVAVPGVAMLANPRAVGSIEIAHLAAQAQAAVVEALVLHGAAGEAPGDRA